MGLLADPPPCPVLPSASPGPALSPAWLQGIPSLTLHSLARGSQARLLLLLLLPLLLLLLHLAVLAFPSLV